MWYKNTYIHRRDWLIEHFERLDVSHEELVVLLMIDLLNQGQNKWGPKELMSKTKQSKEQLDTYLQTLSSKKMLKLETIDSRISFNIDGVFNKINPFEQSEQHDLLTSFEREFGRPLSRQELVTLNDMKQKYDQQVIIYGLRQAIVNNRLSMNYILKIVKDKQ